MPTLLASCSFCGFLVVFVFFFSFADKYEMWIRLYHFEGAAKGSETALIVVCTEFSRVDPFSEGDTFKELCPLEVA